MNNICKTAALGLVAGALALSTGAQAQMDNSTGGTMNNGTMSGGTMNDGTMSGGTMSGGTMNGGSMSGDMSGSMSGGMMSTPTAVSGTVLRYYVDRAGFVSAMDVQAADGVKMLRFSPSMAQRLTATYPVGSQIDASFTSSGMGSMMNYDLAGLGKEMPSPSAMMMPTNITDLDVLRAEPFIMLGAKTMGVSGKLTGYIPDPKTGQVLAIILDQNTLVRVPTNNRLPQASVAPEGVTPLFKNADVVAYGFQEAPRYGVVSPFSRRLVAQSIAVNGRALGAFGFGAMMPKSQKTLLNFNLNFFGGASPREVEASNMGYSTYMMPGSSDMSGGMGTGTGMSGGMGSGTDMSGGTMNSTGGTMNSTTPGM